MNNDLHCYCWEIGHRNSHIIAIIKPERSHRMPERFMSISLLRHPRKLFEGLILNWTVLIIEIQLIPQQAGIRQSKSAKGQLLKIPQRIADSFEKELIRRAVLVDLSAA